jgi:hypothetical protein
MKPYRPWLVVLATAIAALLLSGCYYVPEDGTTGGLWFMIASQSTSPLYDALRVELFLEEDTSQPLPIGPNGDLFVDFPISFPGNEEHGPFIVADIPARRRYVIRVQTWDFASGYAPNGPQFSAPFEVLPGQTVSVDVDFPGI